MHFLRLSSIPARTAVWLATILVACQGMSVPKCGCTATEGKRCGCCDGAAKQSCCSQASASCGCGQKIAGKSRSCRRDNSASSSCCKQTLEYSSSGCQCGPHCQCRQRRAPVPTAPTHRNRLASEKRVDQLVSAASSPLPCDGSSLVFGLRLNLARHLSANAADQCVFLCRFML